MDSMVVVGGVGRVACACKEGFARMDSPCAAMRRRHSTVKKRAAQLGDRRSGAMRIGFVLILVKSLQDRFGVKR